MRRAPRRRRTAALTRTRASLAGLLGAALLCTGSAAVAVGEGETEAATAGTTTAGTSAAEAVPEATGSGPQLLCADGTAPDAEALASATPEEIESALAAGEPLPGCDERTASAEPAPDEPADAVASGVPGEEPTADGATGPPAAEPELSTDAPATESSADAEPASLAPLEMTPLAAVSPGAALRGGFEIDGNLTPGDLPGTPGDDWAGVSYGEAADGLNDATQFSSKDTKEGDAPSGWQPGSGTASDQADIDKVWTHDRVVSGTQWLYLGFSRSTGSGSIGYSLELNQLSNVVNAHGVSVPNRSAGDVRVGFTQSGNGLLSVVDVARWAGTATGGSWTSLAVSGAVLGLANAADLPATAGFPAMPTSTFVEAAFDLTALEQDTTCTRAGFTQANLRSRQSQSMTSQMKDHAVAPVSIPPRCADLTVTKVAENGQALTGAEFTIAPSPDGGGAPQLVVTDGGPGDLDGAADGRISLRTSDFGTYTVTETRAPTGYLLATPRSQTWTAAAYVQSALRFVDPLGAVSWTKVDQDGAPVAGATFTLSPTGGDAGELLGPDHDLVVTDDGPHDADPDAGELRVEGLFTGTWELVETAVPAGYDPQRVPAPIAFEIADENPERLVGPAPELGELVNHRLTTVTVVKTVTPRLTPAGTRPPDEPGAGWQFTAEAPAGVTVTGSGLTGSDGTTQFALSVPAGTSTVALAVAETMQPGYTLAPQDGLNAACVADGAPLGVSNGDPAEDPYGFEVAVPAGSAVTCYVDNRELEVGVDIVKRAWFVPAGETPADGEDLLDGGYAELVHDPEGMQVPSLASGTTVWWSYTVTNTGELDLEGLLVTDDVLAPTADDPVCTIPELGAGDSFTCIGSGPVTRR